LQERKYNHFEERRRKLIDEAIKRRKEIIEEERNIKKVKKSSSAAYILEQGSTMLREEREKLQNMKNQQIAELKNIIEYEFKLEEIKKRNEEKRKIIEKKKLALEERKKKIEENNKEFSIRLEKLKKTKINEIINSIKQDEKNFCKKEISSFDKGKITSLIRAFLANEKVPEYIVKNLKIKAENAKKK
jgi:hypothetical protein